MTTTYSFQSSQGQVASSAAAIVSPGTSTKGFILADSFYNDNTTTETLVLYIVASGDTAAADTTVKSINIATKQTVQGILAGQVIPSGGTVHAVTTTAAKVTYTIGWRQIVE